MHCQLLMRYSLYPLLDGFPVHVVDLQQGQLGELQLTSKVLVEEIHHFLLLHQNFVPSEELGVGEGELIKEGVRKIDLADAPQDFLLLMEPGHFYRVVDAVLKEPDGDQLLANQEADVVALHGVEYALSCGLVMRG